MKKPPVERERENRIRDAIIVDAYGSDEQAMGWYYYLDARLRFPFEGECRTSRRTSPLRPGERFRILAMAPEEECGQEMFVMIAWREGELAIPLSQVAVCGADAETIEAVGDWRYWVEMGYEFG